MKKETVGLVYMLLLRNISDYILQKLSHVTLDFKLKKKKRKKEKAQVLFLNVYCTI